MFRKKKNIEIGLPIVFEEIDLGNPLSIEKSKEAIEKYQGQIVLLKDTHHTIEKGSYYLGIPTRLKQDSECYNFESLDKNNLKTLHYHDLEGLMVPQGLTIETLIKIK